MDYSPWSSKNSIDRNRPKKFMQTWVDVTCMYTNFGGHDLFGLKILVLSKMAKFPFRPMDYSPWSSKNLINRNRPKKIMQVGIDVKCMHIKFDGCVLSGFGDIGTFKNGQISLSTHGLWSLKNSIDWNQPKKFMQTWVDVTCMYTNFGGRGLFGFGDICTFKNGQISLSTHGL